MEWGEGGIEGEREREREKVCVFVRSYFMYMMV